MMSVSCGHPLHRRGRVGEAHEGLRGTEEGPGSLLGAGPQNIQVTLGRALPSLQGSAPTLKSPVIPDGFCTPVPVARIQDSSIDSES